MRCIRSASSRQTDRWESPSASQGTFEHDRLPATERSQRSTKARKRLSADGQSAAFREDVERSGGSTGRTVVQ